MPTTVSDIIDQAFQDLGVIQPGEVITTLMRNAAFLIFKQMYGSWLQEDLANFNAVSTAFTLVANIDNYTLGPGGTFDTVVYPYTRVTAWRARSGSFTSGGPISTTDQFYAARNQRAEASVLPELVAADSAYPLIHIRVFPFPAPVYGGTTMASLELQGWFETPAFTAVGNSVDGLPSDYQSALHFNLAVALAPQYARVGGVTPELAANASNSKAAIVAKNAAILGLSQGPQPAA